MNVVIGVHDDDDDVDEEDEGERVNIGIQRDTNHGSTNDSSIGALSASNTTGSNTIRSVRSLYSGQIHAKDSDDNNDDDDDDEFMERNDETRDSNGQPSCLQRSKDIVTDLAHEVEKLGGEAMEDLKTITNRLINPIQLPAKKKRRAAKGSMYELIGDSLYNAIMVYALADVRRMVREGTLPQLEEILRLPAKRADLLRLCRLHEEDIMSNMGKLTVENYYLSALKILRSDMTQPILDARRSQLEKLQLESDLVLCTFDDENHASEFVYSIEIDSSKQQICVAFRGSVTISDWKANIQSGLSFVIDPTFRTDEAMGQDGDFVAHDSQRRGSRRVGVHFGYSEYLFARDPDSGKSKYQKLMDELSFLVQRYEDYSLLVTGHSLGGALATLFAFFVACEEWTPLVQCVTFASPRVGNIEFARAFRRMESTGKLRKLRIVNHLDPVTRVPDRLTCLTFLHQRAQFHHVGYELRFYSDSRWGKKKTFYYPLVRQSFIRQLAHDALVGSLRAPPKTLYFVLVHGVCCVCTAQESLHLHSFKTYMQRIHREEGDLSHLNLENLYRKVHSRKYMKNTTSQFWTM